MTRGHLLRQLYALVHYHRSCGLVGYHCKTPVEKILNECTQPAKASPAAHRPVKPGSVEVEAGSSQQTLPALHYITAEITACRRCLLHHERVASTPGSGALRPKLLVVGEWLRASSAQSVPDGTLFGVEEDRMLGRMMAAIALTSGDVFVTNIIKCAVPATIRPPVECAAMCAAYIKQQIEVLEPLVICAMGALAARSLVGDERPLSMLRGRFSSFRNTAGKDLPLVVTYHPSFLLENPEMKQAAWSDLQMVCTALQRAAAPSASASR
jgi:DNA polymerase